MDPLDGSLLDTRHKYQTPRQTNQADPTGFGALFAPDPNNLDDRGYYNHSIYFDSPVLDHYFEKHEGLSQRIKPRLRLYKETADGEPKGYYLELKKRTDRVLLKERAPVRPDIARDLLTGRPIHRLAAPSVCHALGEFHDLNHLRPLAPAVAILYHRSAYHSPIYFKLRLTFDRGVRASLDTRLDAPSGAFVHALDPRLMIVELEYTDRVPDIVLQRCRKLQLAQVIFSKFATAPERCLGGDRQKRFGPS